MYWKLNYCIKMSRRTPKITKNDTTLMLLYVDTRIFLKAIRGNGYHFVPKDETFPTETIMLVVRSSGLWEAYIPKPAPNGTKILPRHVDATPCLHAKFQEFQTSIRFHRILKPGISMFSRQSTVPWCLKFIPISCMGPKHAPKDTDLFFQPICMHWSMCM